MATKTTRRALTLSGEQGTLSQYARPAALTVGSSELLTAPAVPSCTLDTSTLSHHIAGSSHAPNSRCGLHREFLYSCKSLPDPGLPQDPAAALLQEANRGPRRLEANPQGPQASQGAPVLTQPGSSLSAANSIMADARLPRGSRFTSLGKRGHVAARTAGVQYPSSGAESAAEAGDKGSSPQAGAAPQAVSRAGPAQSLAKGGACVYAAAAAAAAPLVCCLAMASLPAGLLPTVWQLARQRSSRACCGKRQILVDKQVSG